MSLIEIISSIFLLSGSLMILCGSIGIVRFPDALSRSHSLGKAMTLGIILILAGMAVYFQDEINGLKVGLAILFQLITIPLAGHLLVMTIYRRKNTYSTPTQSPPPQK